MGRNAPPAKIVRTFAALIMLKTSPARTLNSVNVRSRALSAKRHAGCDDAVPPWLCEFTRPKSSSFARSPSRMKTIVHAQSRRDRHTILVIGDNVGPLKRIAFALQHRSHTVLWAQYGRDALRSVRLESPDLVVCEIDLPDISGFDVCHRVKSALLTKT